MARFDVSANGIVSRALAPSIHWNETVLLPPPASGGMRLRLPGEEANRNFACFSRVHSV
jgi:hypothetical protein